ncbi:MAG: hypothetical protein OIF40_08460 [Mangrovicoccus sp.]|nr:hypothetical protein [Mangrovicoccus sp.]
MSAPGDASDPKGLIREAYRIDGISDGECRSILVDWALSLPDEVDAQAALAAHLERYGARHPDHPMTVILREGAAKPTAPRRRGGGRARRQGWTGPTGGSA